MPANKKHSNEKYNSSLSNTMFMSFNSININTVKIKYVLISLLLLISLFLAFNHYPPIMSFNGGVEIYKDFLPTHNPPLILSISEDPTTNGPFNTFGYAALILSRYVSDYLGHSLSNVRLPSVIYGLIALFLFYVIVNRWFDWKVALVSTFLLATNMLFLMFQHFLVPQMVTLTSILFCIERFQNLLTKNTKFAILSFGFACALTTLNYWAGRWAMLCVLLFYLVDFEKFSIWKYKTYLYFTNLQRIKTLLLVFISMIIILTIFYPGNLLLLFSSDFIYPSYRVGEYSNKVSETLYNIWHNLGYYFKYYIFNKSNYPTDMVFKFTAYPVENMITLVLCLLGIIISLVRVRKITYSLLFLLYILFITFIPALFSDTTSTAIYISGLHGEESSSKLHGGRVLFVIPFICVMAVLGVRYIYAYSITRNYSSRSVFIFLISVFFCVRLYGYFTEIERFNAYINSHEINFSPSAISGDIQYADIADTEIHYNQHVYYYQMAQLVSDRLKTLTSNSNSINLLYIPAEIHILNMYRKGIPKTVDIIEKHPYSFPMYLTFYLQEEGVNVSYLVKKGDIKETLLKKAIRIVDRYNLSKSINSNGTLSASLYPRGKKQEEIVEMFNKIIRWIESYERGEKWLNSIREQTHFKPNILSIGDYFVNVTSRKTPDYLIILNEEELDQVRQQTDYELVLSLPLL